MRKRILNENARNLRKQPTDVETLLWAKIRGRQIEGLKFRRQHVIGPYIVDFVCLCKRVVIELDGGQHAVERKKDEVRDNWLRREGYVVLRFWNHEVFENLEGVLEAIRKELISPSP